MYDYVDFDFGEEIAEKLEKQKEEFKKNLTNWMGYNNIFRIDFQNLKLQTALSNF